jgi:hypothetical protein
MTEERGGRGMGTNRLRIGKKKKGECRITMNEECTEAKAISL